MTALVVWRVRRAPGLATGWFWYLGTLVQVIGLVQVGAQSIADRYTYIPLVGLWIMLCWAVPRYGTARTSVKITLGIIMGIALTVCAVLTRIQVGYWKADGTLFRRALDVRR